MTEQEFLSQFRPLAQNLLDYAMTEGLNHGITDARIFVSAADKLENSVEKGQVTKTVSGKTYNVGVTLYAGDRVLSFTKNTLDEQRLKEAMLDNMKVISLVPANADKKLLEAEKVFSGEKQDLDLFDNNPPSTATLIQYAKDVEKAAMAQPGVKATRSVSITRAEDHILILGSNGLDLHDSRTVYSAGASVIAEDKSGMQISGESSVARHFSDMAKPDMLGADAGQKAISKLGAILPATGEMPVVLDNSAAESFFSSVYSAIGGTALHRGTTFLKGKLGVQVMASGITLSDDPLLPRGLSSRQVDTAGLESKPITFIENGVLKSYDVNLTESRQLGIDPIGRENGPTNSRVAPGALSPAELIADIKEGIFIKGFNGGTVDVNTGNHSREAYGLLIKDGKITDTAVAGFVVSGNLKDMFMKVAVANDTPELPSTKHRMAAPTTRINGVTIAGK
ncbi:MAG TPA: TldD/PmbA family protein [Patescibacteria group bacterium]|nr:TldD/PmbA family protein [Patescibacteria group bacterium]